MSWLLWIAGAIGLLLLHWYMVAGACEIAREEEHEQFQRAWEIWRKTERAHIVHWLRERAKRGDLRDDVADAIERGDDWLTPKDSVHPPGEQSDE